MKRGLYILLCVMLAVSLSGCWNRKEPKTLALVNSAIFDLDDSGGYQVTAEVINPAAQGGLNSSGSGKKTSIIITSQGSSLPETIRNSSESLEKTLFGGHVKVRLFSERFIQKGIGSMMDFLLRDHLADENPLMVVLKHEEPKDIYSAVLGLSETVGDYLDNMSKTQPDITSKSIFVDTLAFIKDYYNEGKQPVCGVVELVEDDEPSKNAGADSASAEGSQSDQGSDKKYKLIYSGLAAFKDDKLVGYMDEVEARAYNFITDNVNSAVITIGSENSQTVVIVKNPKANIKVDLQSDEIAINVKVKTNLSIIQENGALDIREPEALRRIETAFNEQMTEEITAAIQKAQNDFGSDIFGFGVSMHKQHPEMWKVLKENWDDSFAKAAINVSVESTVDRSGEIKQPFNLEGGA